MPRALERILLFALVALGSAVRDDTEDTNLEVDEAPQDFAPHLMGSSEEVKFKGTTALIIGPQADHNGAFSNERNRAAGSTAFIYDNVFYMQAASTEHVRQALEVIQRLVSDVPEDFLDHVRFGMHGSHGGSGTPFGELGTGAGGKVIRGDEGSTDMYEEIYRALKPGGTFFLNSCGGADASSGDSQLKFIIEVFETGVVKQEKLIRNQMPAASPAVQAKLQQMLNFLKLPEVIAVPISFDESWIGYDESLVPVTFDDSGTTCPLPREKPAPNSGKSVGQLVPSSKSPNVALFKYKLTLVPTPVYEDLDPQMIVQSIGVIPFVFRGEVIQSERWVDDSEWPIIQASTQAGQANKLTYTPKVEGRDGYGLVHWKGSILQQGVIVSQYFSLGAM